MAGWHWINLSNEAWRGCDWSKMFGAELGAPGQKQRGHGQTPVRRFQPKVVARPLFGAQAFSPLLPFLPRVALFPRATEERARSGTEHICNGCSRSWFCLHDRYRSMPFIWFPNLLVVLKYKKRIPRSVPLERRQERA